MKELLLQIIPPLVAALVPIILGVIGLALRKWLTSKSENELLEYIKSIIYQVVYSVEQQYKSTPGLQKREMALAAIRKILGVAGVAYDEELLIAILEATVHEKNQYE